MSYSHYYPHDITRNGFAYADGNFYVNPGRMERVKKSSLERMFLPNVTPEGRRRLRESYSDTFVRGQLKHYGVQFNEHEISGNGSLLMKKVLQAGKCDKVPDHISKLRQQMHTEWLNKRTPEQLSCHPEWVIEKYFLSSGRPDQTKTTTVVGIPYPSQSSFIRKKMHEAVNEVMDLHQATGRGPKTTTIFMGWHSVAARNAAESHVAKETKELQAAKQSREDKRAKMHTDYLNTLKRKKGPMRVRASPVGNYIVDCEEIEVGYLEHACDLSIDIRRTKEPTVFEASFNFGMLVGVMIIGAEKDCLEKYCSQLDLEGRSDYEGSDGTEDEDEYGNKTAVNVKAENDKTLKTGSKRKAQASRGQNPPSKKSRAQVSQPSFYLLRMKCRATEDYGGEIYPEENKGTITFQNENWATFVGKANFPCVGNRIPFTARKVSDTPSSYENSWVDYSESAYEYARVNRWR